MMTTIKTLAFPVGLSLAMLAGSACSDESLNPPAVPSYTGGAMFQRYVSMGNSITGGFQSGGINDSTQQQSYAVQMAVAMGAKPFYLPTLAKPGCPAPIDTLFTATGIPHTIGGAAAPPCSLRNNPPLTPYINDVAVPGATSFDPFHVGPTISSNALTQFILAGRSQIQAMRVVQPTFVSVWIGNNDVLGAATSSTNAGNPALVTPVALFRVNYDSMLAGLDSTTSIKGAVLIGVVDVAAIPFFSYGQVYLGAKLAGQLPPSMTVAASCAPRSSGGIGDTVLVPFPYGFAKIDSALAGAPVTLDCTDDHNIEPAELANIHATVASYDTIIHNRATARHWAYFDPNAALGILRQDTSQVRIFPNPAATNCSGVGAAGSPFGLAFSCDGIHPSASTHHLIAQSIVQTINATYGSAIPLP